MTSGMNADRAEFLSRRRRDGEIRMDRIAADYDHDWGEIFPSMPLFSIGCSS